MSVFHGRERLWTISSSGFWVTLEGSTCSLPSVTVVLLSAFCPKLGPTVSFSHPCKLHRFTRYFLICISRLDQKIAHEVEREEEKELRGFYEQELPVLEPCSLHQ